MARTGPAALGHRTSGRLDQVNGFREEVARLVDECQKDQAPPPATGKRPSFRFDPQHRKKSNRGSLRLREGREEIRFTASTIIRS